MSPKASKPTMNDWKTGQSGPLHTATLFMDLVSSSDFASVMSLRDYARYVESFHRLCQEQCEYFFKTVCGQYYTHDGTNYEFHVVGDEMVVFLHSPKPANDVYQLICLAVTLKCGWLGLPINRARLKAGLSSTDLAAGIHCGEVWATRTREGFHKCGYAINVAKRTESTSREGDRFRIMVSDAAFKQINRKIRNVLFSPRRVISMKGIVVPIGVYEVAECFMDISKRLKPEFTAGFARVARLALKTNTFDLWVHSCLQVMEEARNRKVTGECLELCERVLNIDPDNPVALYYAAQGMRERGDSETARLYYKDLARHWPKCAEGWLDMGRLLKTMGRMAEARECILQARRRAVDPSEEELPPVEGT